MANQQAFNLEFIANKFEEQMKNRQNDWIRRSQLQNLCRIKEEEKEAGISQYN